MTHEDKIFIKTFVYPIMRDLPISEKISEIILKSIDIMEEICYFIHGYTGNYF